MSDAVRHAGPDPASARGAASAPGGGRRRVRFPTGDRVAFVAGIALMLLLVGFFTWRMSGNLARDRALGPVPASTPTPPPPPAP